MGGKGQKRNSSKPVSENRPAQRKPDMMNTPKSADGETNMKGNRIMALPEEFAQEGATVMRSAQDALQRLQDELGYVEGNRLSKVLAEEQPSAAATVRTAFKGKGWLKKFLLSDPSI